MPSPSRPFGYMISVPGVTHATSVVSVRSTTTEGNAATARPWTTWRKSSVSIGRESRLARVSDVRVVMTLRADGGDAELLEAQRAFHLAAGVDEIVEPGDLSSSEADW